MKIFISHSSKDKWAARRISDDLIEVGAEIFLDEKDIKTGQSIDQEIKRNLKVCEDFLIILSPASLKSDWVLLELGGAIALGKNIIPILLYVGANEIPQIINLRLARDINEVNVYCQEIAKKLKVKSSTNKVTPKRKILAKSIKQKAVKNKFKIGDSVKIISYKPKDVYKDELLIDWEKEMDSYMGQTTKIRDTDNDGTYYLELDKHLDFGGYVWAEEWLIPIPKKK